MIQTSHIVYTLPPKYSVFMSLIVSRSLIAALLQVLVWIVTLVKCIFIAMFPKIIQILHGEPCRLFLLSVKEKDEGM